MVQIFYYSGNIACDISGITTKAPCEAALMGERHVRIEISDSVLRTFVFHEPTRRRRDFLRIRLQKSVAM